jgi:UDP:flavonoid glycosyltransferase YjiC (YdhE family)
VSRVALVAGPDPGHLFPVLAIADALVADGHDVVVLTGDDRRSDVESRGLAFATLPLEWPDDRHADLGYRLWELGGRLAPATADVLAGHGPDVVVVDTLTQSGAMAAELLDVPWIEVIPHHLPDPDPALPAIGLGRLPRRGMLRRPDEQRLHRLQSRSLAAGRAHRDRVRHELGLHGPGRPTLRLVASLPSLEYPRSRWPTDTHLVGPLGWDPPWPSLEVPMGTEPLVVVTDSSASTVPWELGAFAMDALRNLSIRLAVVTRGDLQPWPSRCVVGWGPHGPLLDQAALAITPGGAGVTGKALQRGVPLVTVPIQGDQQESAARVVWSGAGRRIRRWQRTPQWLRAAAVSVLHDPSYRQAAQRLATEAAVLGPTRAAALVAAVAAGDRPVARGPQR